MTDVAIGGIAEATAAGAGVALLVDVVFPEMEVVGRTGVSTGGELGADTGDATEGGDAHEGSAEEEAAAAVTAAFMLSNLFSNHWYNLFLSTGTKVSIKSLHFSSIATNLRLIISGGERGGKEEIELKRKTKINRTERTMKTTEMTPKRN